MNWLRLFPKILPYRTHTLPVDGRHALYIEECGRQDGLPVIFLHGGPGSGSEPWYRRFFDPSIYHIVLFDQRGCGRSTPHAELRDNTTSHLVDDIEKIRSFLGIERWVVFGGSWGATLALIYAQSYRDHVLGLILRGVFLCRPEDIRWFYQTGASRIFPDYWDDFVAPIPPEERNDLISAYQHRLTGDNEIERMAAARAWATWEMRVAKLITQEDESHLDPYATLALARIENHYFANHGFLTSNQLLAQAHRLSGMAGVIVQGRYDVICPPAQAWGLHRAWPDAKFEIIPDAGHSAKEPGIIDALIRATNDFGAKLA